MSGTVRRPRVCTGDATRRRPRVSTGDQPIAHLAAHQHGVVARWQLIRLGYGASAIRRRQQAGRLHIAHRGVYAVGHRRLTRHGRLIAAVLACGPDAVLSHWSAAALWELRLPPAGPIHVTVPGSRRSRRGIRVHCVNALHAEDRATVDGIPITSLHRTLLDFAETAPYQQLRLAIEAAERLELLDFRTLERLCARSRGHGGLTALKAAARELRGPIPWTRSELERRFQALCRETGIPAPSANIIVAGYLVDFFWPAQRLVAEVDGYKWHKTRRKFEDDRRKDVQLQLAGYRIVRFTETRLKDEPGRVAQEVKRMLSASPARAASGR